MTSATPGADPAASTRLRVERLTARDVDAYRALMLEAYTRAPDAFTSTAEERAAEPRAWWERRIADASGLTACFGGFVDDDLVGTVALDFESKPKTRHKGYLIGMYVRDGARGMGLGRRLVERALDFAATRPGLRILLLTVTQGNVAAERLYASCGFQAFGVEPMAIRGHDDYLAKVHMWRSVAGSSS